MITDDGGFYRRETAADREIAWCENCDQPLRDCQGCARDREIETEQDYRGDDR
jgi:hypothetical protein